ncbi:MAG: hypothetical protein IPM40_20960 [Gammaproteobacteria bacterium]|nr:hypothetical protein [Gammaproteobacteria bacterium]
MQILRGPQGTLFGRNTTGGAVLLGPKKPSDAFEGYAQLQGGNYDNLEFEGAASIPLIEDTLLVRLAYKDVEREGFTEDVGPAPFGYDDICQPMTSPLCGAFAPPGTRSQGFRGKEYDDQDYWHGRVGVLWRPTDRIENYFVAYQAESKDNGTGFRFDGAGAGPNVANLTGNMAYNPSLVYIPGRNLFDPTVTPGVLAVQNGLSERKTAMNVDQFTEIEAQGLYQYAVSRSSRTTSLCAISPVIRHSRCSNWDTDDSILPMLSQQPPVNMDSRNPLPTWASTART